MKYQTMMKKRMIDFSKCAFVGYTRCSSDEQAKGYSHGYQRSGIERSHIVSDMKNLGWYNDTVTGRNFTERVELDSAFKFLRNLQKQKHGFEKIYLIAYKTDRFGRTVEGCFGSIRKFQEIGIEVNFSEEWCDYCDDNWAMLLSVKFGIAETESRKIGSRTKDGLIQMALQGEYPYSMPFGYKRVPTGQIVKGKERKRVVKDDKTSDIVQRIFKEFLSGVEQNDIFTKLNNFPLSKSGFYRVFQTPLYAGFMVNPTDQNQLIKMNYEPYITLEQYELIQTILGSKTHTATGKTWSTSDHKSEMYWLKGILKCDITGATMTAYSTTKKKRNLSYDYYQTAKLKTRQIISVQKAHNIVVNTIAAFQFDRETQFEIIEQTQTIIEQQLSSKKRELQQIKRQIEQNDSRLKNIFNDYADRNITSDEYRNMTSKLTTEQNDFAQRKARLETLLESNNLNFKKLGQFVCNLKSIFQSADSEKKRQILKAMFPKGFSIDSKFKKVRTKEINNVFFTICSKSIIYEHIILEFESENDDVSMMGAAQYKVRTIDNVKFMDHAHMLLLAA